MRLVNIYILIIISLFSSCRKDPEIIERVDLSGDYRIVKTKTGYSEGFPINEIDTFDLTITYTDVSKNYITYDLGGYWGNITNKVDNVGEVHSKNVYDTDSYERHITVDSFYSSESHWTALGADITTIYNGVRIE